MATFDIDLFLRYLTVREINELLGENFRQFPRSIRNVKNTYIEEVIKAGYGQILADAVEEKVCYRREEYNTRNLANSNAHRNWRNSLSREQRGIVGSSMREVEEEGCFLDIPSTDERRQLYQAFRESTSNAAIAFNTCAVCARSLLNAEVPITKILLSDLPNRHLLRASHQHPIEEVVSGILLLPEACSGVIDPEISVCAECLHQLQQKDRRKPPIYSLANKLWIGRIPWELRCLTLPEQLLVARLYPRMFVVKLFPKTGRMGHDPSTLQTALHGNVTTFALNLPKINDMIEGRIMPQEPRILAAVVSVTFVGIGNLPKSWLHSTFRVRRHHVGEALRWLKVHNPKYYGDIQIQNARLDLLPLDDVPHEILDMVRQDETSGAAERESAGYVPDGLEGDGNRDSSVSDVQLPVTEGEMIIILTDKCELTF